MLFHAHFERIIFHQKRGNHKTTWDGRDFSNNKSSPGIYFVKIQIGDYQSNQKIILLK